MAEPALAEAIGAERAYLMRYAKAKLRDASLAEDLVQETLLAALQGADAFEHRAALRTWLTGILLRRMADHGRSRARRPEVEVADLDPAETDTPAPDAIDWIDPARQLEGRQWLATVQRTLTAVSPQAAELVTLRELDGLSHEDAAQRLGLTAAHAASLLHRARTRVRELSERAAPLPRARWA